MSTVKDELTSLIQDQPEDSSSEDIVRELCVSRNDQTWPCRFRCEAGDLERRDGAPYPLVATIRWTAEAERWLADIYEYIAADNPRAVGETVEGIYQLAKTLLENPERGSRYRMSQSNIRILLYSHYRIVYLVKDDRDVDILGVFHGALDITRYQL